MLGSGLQAGRQGARGGLRYRSAVATLMGPAKLTHMDTVKNILAALALTACAAAQSSGQPKGVFCTTIADSAEYNQTVCKTTLGGRTQYTVQELGFGQNSIRVITLGEYKRTLARLETSNKLEEITDACLARAEKITDPLVALDAKLACHSAHMRAIANSK